MFCSVELLELLVFFYFYDPCTVLCSYILHLLFGRTNQYPKSSHGYEDLVRGFACALQVLACLGASHVSPIL